MRNMIYPVLLVLLLTSCTPQNDDLEAVSRVLPTGSSKQQRLLKRAFAAYSRRDIRAARRDMEALVTAGIEHPILLYRLAVVTGAAGEAEKAKALYLHAAEGFKKSGLHHHRYAAYSLVGIGNYHFRKKLPDTAKEWYERALALRREDPLLLTRIGEFYFQQNRFELAISYLSRVKGHTPGLLLLAEAYLKLERYRAARQVLTPLYRASSPFSADGNIRIAMDYGLSLIGIAQYRAGRKEYKGAYELAFQARGIFLKVVERFTRSGPDAFLDRLSPHRRQYFITRSREYLKLCGQMIRKYEKHLH